LTGTLESCGCNADTMLESTTFRNQEGYLTKFRNQTVAHSATKRVAIPQHSATKGGHPSLLEEGGVGADDGEEGAQRQQEEAHLGLPDGPLPPRRAVDERGEDVDHRRPEQRP